MTESGKGQVPVKSQKPVARINLTLQGKGGVGKSFISSILAQCLKSQNRNVVCIDTDPIQQSFAKIKALKVQHLDLSMGGQDDEINSRAFDGLIEQILNIEKDTDFIIDNGSGSYLPLISYLVENQVIPFLQEAGHEIIFHAVLVGGPAESDTEQGLKDLLKYFEDARFTIWINNFFGRYKNGVTFTDTKLYADNEELIHAIINIEQWRKDTFGQDIQTMMEQAQTFDQFIEDKNHSIMARQRLKQVQKVLFQSVELAQL